jgi:hypothetical protein
MSLLRGFLLPTFAASVFPLWAALVTPVSAPETVEQWGVFELELAGPKDGNPFLDVQLAAEFSNGTRTIAGDVRAQRVPGGKIAPCGIVYSASACCCRYSRGVHLQARRKASLNRLIELKPELNAISTIFASVVASRRCACEMR